MKSGVYITVPPKNELEAEEKVAIFVKIYLSFLYNKHFLDVRNNFFGKYLDFSPNDNFLRNCFPLLFPREMKKLSF